MNASNSDDRNPAVALRQNEKTLDTAGLRPARSADRAAIEALLESSGLPVEGVGEGLDGFWVYVEDGALLGAVGLELYGTAGLLRSTAVAASATRRGIAAALVEHALAYARKRGCQAVYLLTLDAERYFQRFGFTVTGRDDAPKAIGESPEFTTLCPASAVLMRKILKH
jgi:amino-acid N-acetyltransferase